MTYLVMENHLSYSVVLDEAGRFLKVANLCYEVGQTVNNVIPLKSKMKTRPSIRVVGMVGSIASCFVLMFSLYWYNYLSPIGSVYLMVNPDVQIEVSRRDTVVELVGLNNDGLSLIGDFSYGGKSLEIVVNELMDKAIYMGYLSDGDTITIQLDAPNEEWFIREGFALRENLDSYLNGKVTINVIIQEYDPNNPNPEQSTPDKSQAPPSSQAPTPSSSENMPAPSQHYGGSGYDDDDGDSEYVPSSAPTTNPQSLNTITPTPVGGDSEYDDNGSDSRYDDGDGDSEYAPSASPQTNSPSPDTNTFKPVGSDDEYDDGDSKYGYDDDSGYNDDDDGDSDYDD